MLVTCLDMEGVLVPEIWIAFAEATGIPEFARTTRDEPDYARLMHYRMDLLHKHGLGLSDIQACVEGIEPYPGAKEFLGRLRKRGQFVIVSDVMYEIALPVFEKLGNPFVICNNLHTNEQGEICDFTLHAGNSKGEVVRGLQKLGMTTFAAGDSHNDLSMIKASACGAFFRAPENLRLAHPDIPAFQDYDELYDFLDAAYSRFGA